MRIAIFICAILFLLSTTIFVWIEHHGGAWDGQNLSELGTFLGGTLGPFAILFAALQYLQAANQQQVATKQAIEERNRSDLRYALERRNSELEKLLERSCEIHNGEKFETTFRDEFASFFSGLRDHSRYDFKKIESEARSDNCAKFDSNTVAVIEHLSRIAMNLNWLKDIAEEFDKVSSHNVETSELRRTYQPLIRELSKLHYPVDQWDVPQPL